VTVSPSPNPLSDLSQLVRFEFMVNALWAGAIVAVLAAVVGWYMIVRRQAYAGHSLSVMAFPGAAGAALAGIPAAWGFYVACALAALAIGAGGRRGARRGLETAAIGTVQAVGLGAGFLFLSLNTQLLGGPETLLFGTFLGITRGQVLGQLWVAVACLGALALIGRPLLFASVDATVARAAGVPVRRLSQGFLLVLGLAVAATAQLTGALLVFALLVGPPATAQLLTARIGRGLLLAVALGVLTTWLALALAFFLNLPVGFPVTAIALAAFGAASLTRGRTR
jgi:zinc/manganese transport system permease protein